MTTISSGCNGVATPVPDTEHALPTGARRLCAQSFGASRKGKERESNQDQFFIATLTGAMWVHQSSMPQANALIPGGEQGHLFVVADGMGGAAAGECASAVAVGTIEQFALGALKWLLTLEEGPNETAVLGELKAALRSADARVCEEAARHPELRGMGTTVTLAYSVGPRLFIAHVGDSRAYLMHAGRLARLTQDHTLVQQMVAQGLLTPERAAQHDFRHVITNVVGGNVPGVQTEVHRLDLVPGDTLVLCTDGVADPLGGERIAAIVAAEPEPRAAVEALVAGASEHGGDDATAIVVRYR